jgi:hypothetical protein
VRVTKTKTLFEDERRETWGRCHIRVREGASKDCLFEIDRTQQQKFLTDWMRRFANLGRRSQVVVSCALVHSLYLTNEDSNKLIETIRTEGARGRVSGGRGIVLVLFSASSSDLRRVAGTTGLVLVWDLPGRGMFVDAELTALSN